MLFKNPLFKLMVFKLLLVLLLLGICFWGARFLACFIHQQPFSDADSINSPDTTSSEIPKQVIVIDPGHGGRDPGKIGINNALEKDLNLSISLRLKKILEQKNFQVILTRTSDCDLSCPDSLNHKNDDLHKRIELINNSKPVLVVSIHQNSFSSPSSSAKGSEIFYYKSSEESKALAYSIEKSLYNDTSLIPCRGITANDSYFLLKKSPTPTVIVECGFLSNYSEAELLVSETYQYRLSQAIYLGICNYLGSRNHNSHYYQQCPL